MTVSEQALSRTAELLRSVPMPSRIRALPRNKAGYPIPYFAAEVDGVRDFRVGDPDAYERCILKKLCWVCGQQRTGGDAFVVGPMCLVNLTTPDPPSHLVCAEYAVKVCPFLAIPAMVRRERGLPEGTGTAGIMIKRNPGVSVVVVSRRWRTWRPPGDTTHGILFNLGIPSSVSWWAEGRPATRAEVLASIDSGLPLLEEQCDLDERPAVARKVLARQRRDALAWLPAE